MVSLTSLQTAKHDISKIVVESKVGEVGLSDSPTARLKGLSVHKILRTQQRAVDSQGSAP